MTRSPSKTLTLVLAGVLALLWSTEGEARCGLRRRGCRPQATYSAPSAAKTALTGGCICPYMRYASFPDYEQWTARECPNGLLFARDYPTGTSMGMCPYGTWPCTSPCQPISVADRASHQTEKRDEDYVPELVVVTPVPQETPPPIQWTGENYWFETAAQEKYYVRVLTYKLPRGFYPMGKDQPGLVLLPMTTSASHGFQINPTNNATKITDVSSIGVNVYWLVTPSGPVRVITTGIPD